ncbi:nucleosome assembly protein [Chloropicon primus]|uniref:Nucleosome assembly protein n=1 Tax=Chloropicon primus TaxID=1764295 RepID=A0A5B8MLR2_9CHLO|nr:nucleosome assembly protein [Chloropicon primus]UPQ99806.1 nucleosome assembly protein [Chloropicon primus]|eukprot:QDZ20595.1 nucleosome assembly protein [Chloropicon primus]
MSKLKGNLDEKVVAERMQQLGFDTNDPEKAGLLKATMEKLDKILTANSTSEAILQDLHPKIRGRVEKLRDLQEEYDTLEDAFMEEQRKLVLKYEGLYQPLYDARAEIVSGKQDAQIEAVYTEDEEEAGAAEAGEPAGQGVPEFWAFCLRNNDVVSELITEKDDEVLKYLKDIRYELLGFDEAKEAKDGEGEEQDEDEEEGFKLYFEFEEGNPYFDNKVLVKTYKMIDEEEGILEKSEGSTILWKPGKNVTVKVMRKKNKKGGRSKGPAMTKTEKCESFFNFFSPPDPQELIGMDDGDSEDFDEEEMEELQAALQEDYEIGCIFKDKIIPHAVSWFTGEALEDEEEDMEDEDEEDEEGEGDEEGISVRAQSNSQANTSEASLQGEQPECKQQ